MRPQLAAVAAAFSIVGAGIGIGSGTNRLLRKMMTMTTIVPALLTRLRLGLRSGSHQTYRELGIRMWEWRV